VKPLSHCLYEPLVTRIACPYAHVLEGGDAVVRSTNRQLWARDFRLECQAAWTASELLGKGEFAAQRRGVVATMGTIARRFAEWYREVAQCIEKQQ